MLAYPQRSVSLGDASARSPMPPPAQCSGNGQQMQCVGFVLVGPAQGMQGMPEMQAVPQCLGFQPMIDDRMQRSQQQTALPMTMSAGCGGMRPWPMQQPLPQLPLQASPFEQQQMQPQPQQLQQQQMRQQHMQQPNYMQQMQLQRPPTPPPPPVPPPHQQNQQQHPQQREEQQRPPTPPPPPLPPQQEKRTHHEHQLIEQVQRTQNVPPTQPLPQQYPQLHHQPQQFQHHAIGFAANGQLLPAMQQHLMPFQRSSRRGKSSVNDGGNGRRPKGEMESMRLHLQALQLEDPETVFIVRRINKLGFSSAAMLRKHFSRYGQVKAVHVSHSRVKAQSNRQWRLRAAALGFIVMKSKDVRAQILAEGGEHCVDGVSLLLQPYHSLPVGEDTNSAEHGGADDASQDANILEREDSTISEKDTQRSRSPSSDDCSKSTSCPPSSEASSDALSSHSTRGEVVAREDADVEAPGVAQQAASESDFRCAAEMELCLLSREWLNAKEKNNSKATSDADGTGSTQGSDDTGGDDATCK